MKSSESVQLAVNLIVMTLECIGCGLVGGNHVRRFQEWLVSDLTVRGRERAQQVRRAMSLAHKKKPGKKYAHTKE